MGVVRRAAAATTSKKEEENNLCRPRGTGGRGGRDVIQSSSLTIATMMGGIML